MVTRQIRSVDINERADFDGLLRDLHRHSNTTLTIDIGAETDVLADPMEFEELSTAALHNAVDIEIVTDDPVRQEMATIFGLDVLDCAHQKTQDVLKLRDVDVTRRIPVGETLPDGLPLTAEIRIGEIEEFGPPGRRSGPVPGGTQPSFSFVTATAVEDLPAHRRVQPDRRATRHAQTTRSFRAASIFVSGVVIVAAVAALMVALLAPVATITIQPEVQPLSAQITYGLAGSAENLDVNMEPTPLSTTIAFEASIPSSGRMTVPDEPARGLIFLTNPFTEAILVATGTTFEAPDGGGQYVTLADVELPAADPFESARFGTAVVGIEAVEPGPAGNIGVEVLTGTHESGILFQNRFPVEGGSMREIAVVASGDIEELRAIANDALAKEVDTALDDQIPNGWQLSGEPYRASETQMTFSAAVGAATESVSVVAQSEVAGHVFDPVALERDAREALEGALTSAVPEGFGMTLDSIKFSGPVDASDGVSGVKSMSVTASAEAQFSREELDQLKAEFVGDRAEAVEEGLTNYPGVKAFEMSFGPDWLPWEPIPRFASRISIDVDGS